MTDQDFARARAMMLRLSAQMSHNPLRRLMYRIQARKIERGAER